MTISEIYNLLREAFPEAELMLEDVVPEAVIRVPQGALRQVMHALRDDERLHFECLMCLSGVDKGTELQTVYHLYSMKHHQRVNLRCAVPKDEGSMPSVALIWPTAEWHEREAFDLVGIRYEGHPDLKRIMTPDDWEGHPLRKDYKPQESYHGIPLTSIFPS